MSENRFVGLAGNIGVGKTTFTEKMAEAFNWSPIYESVSDNPYLSAVSYTHLTLPTSDLV